MAHYALLDENNIVVQVITGKDEGEMDIDWEQYYGNFHKMKCKRTSYNTAAGKHIAGGIPFRKNYAGKGFTYDEARDAFIPQQPFPSWILNEDSCTWDSPVPMPESVDGMFWVWNESIVNWQSVKGMEI